MIIANKDLVSGDYVNLDAALALSKVGYDIPTHTHYTGYKDYGNVSLTSNAEKLTGVGSIIDRPILQKAVEWLRERHNISLRINYAMQTHKWFFDYLNMEDGSYDDSTSTYDDTTGYYDSYNDAVNAGIVAICEYIKNNEDTTGKENSIG